MYSDHLQNFLINIGFTVELHKVLFDKGYCRSLLVGLLEYDFILRKDLRITRDCIIEINIWNIHGT